MNNMNVNLDSGLSNPSAPFVSSNNSELDNNLLMVDPMRGLNQNLVMAPEESQNNSVIDMGDIERNQTNLNTNNLNEFQDWRNIFFEKLDCKGVVINAGSGDVLVQGEVKSKTTNPTIMFWAPNPPTWSQSYTGSGLPYHDSIQAYQQSPNVGAVKAVNRKFEFRIKFPNAYYVGLGSLYVPPVVHFKVCEEDCNQKEYHTIELGKGIPFRTLTYPSPPSNKPRDSPMFYHCGQSLPVRTQEQVLRDSGYPEDNRMPDNFWGLKPPL